MFRTFITFLQKILDLDRWAQISFYPEVSPNKRPCPCCGYLTLPATFPTDLICPVCFWEDNQVQFIYPEEEGGPNGCSLKIARENYKKFGAKEERVIKNTRKPRKYEIPKSDKEYFLPDKKDFLQK